MTDPGAAEERRQAASLPALLLATAVSVAFLVLAARSMRYGLPVTDEAYLLHGLDRVLEGQLPIRDFQAYDPGRYWLLAALRSGGRVWAVFFGGYVLVLVSALCLTALVATRLRLRWWVGPGFLLPVLLVWAIPIYKPTDIISVHLLLAATILALRDPTHRRWFGAGVVLGVVALLGRNFGLYGAVALMAAVALADRRDGLRGALTDAGRLVAGALVGWSPMVVLLATDAAMRERYGQLLLRTARFPTNIAVPTPWPWTDAGLADPIGRWAFVLVPAALVAGLVVGLVHRRSGAAWSTVALASALVGLPVLHHTASRAVVYHLALAVGPATVALLALLGRSRETVDERMQRTSLVALVGLSAVLALSALRTWPGFVDVLDPGTTESVTALDERRRLLPEDVEYLGVAAELDDLIDDDETFFAAPRDIGLYLLLDQRPPAYTTYFGIGTTVAEQRDLVEQLADIDWFLHRPEPFAGSERTRFATAYPVLHDALVERCDLVDVLDELEVRRCS